MSLTSILRQGLLAGLAGIIMACGSGGDDSSSKGCNLITNAGCTPGSGRVCVADEKGVGVCVKGDDAYVPDKDIVSEKDNYQPSCTPHFQKICSGDDLYWQDSCGNLEEMIYTCNYGCSGGTCQKWSPEEVMEDVGYDAGPDVLGDIGFEVCEWQCNNGNCIPQSYVCDGAYDCDGGEDESSGAGCNCDWECNNGKCINSDWVCDGEKDCSNGEDEKNCSCPEYTCNDGVCISYEWVCDGGADCSNGEDEQECTPVCDDECVLGNSECEDKWAYKTCITNDLGCTQWSEVSFCDYDLICKCPPDGQCLECEQGCDDPCNYILYYSCEWTGGGTEKLSLDNLCDADPDGCVGNVDDLDCPSSPYNCPDLADCLMNSNDQNSLWKCWAVGSEEARQIIMKLEYCTFKECGPNPSDSCAEQASNGPCYDLIMECMNDN